MATKWFALGVIVAALGCGFTLPGDACPDYDCSSGISVEVDLRNTTAAEACLYAGFQSLNCRVLSGSSRTVVISGLIIGTAVHFRAEVSEQFAALVNCEVTRTEATPIREVVFSGPPYQLTCQNW